jgi:hypothetical protein
MDEPHVDDVSYQEDSSVTDEVAHLQVQYTRMINNTRHLEFLSTFSDYSPCIGDLPSSPARSHLNLSSLSSEPFRSPYTDGSPTTVTDGLGTSSVSSSSMSYCGSSNRNSLRKYDQSCSALKSRLMWFSRRMMHFERASKNWSQLLDTHLTHTYQLLLHP